MLTRRISTALLLALAALAWSVPGEDPRPAFLDSTTELRVAVEPPLTAEAMRGAFAVTRDGVGVQVASVAPGGRPERPRLYPRTPDRLVLAGTFQSELGGTDWNPDDDLTQFTLVREGVYEVVVAVQPGRHEYKIARGGNWNQNWGEEFVPGGRNMVLVVPDEVTAVRFRVDFPGKQILNSIEHPDRVRRAGTPPTRPTGGTEAFPVAVLSLSTPVALEQLDDDWRVTGPDGEPRRVYMRGILDQPALEYGGELGSRWSPASTRFVAWSPVASSASVVLAPGPDERHVAMQRGPNGTWHAEVQGDLHGAAYQLEFVSYGKTRRTQDLHCFAATPDSKSSIVIDLDRTDPEGWPTQPERRHARQTDAVIYELHVRDFTVHSSSGVDATKRGKYAGLVQRGTRSPGLRVRTGLDYLVDLGVTDIHLLPVQNFLTSSYDEYTWGYATNLFNVPEESYAVDRHDPMGVIREFKSMVRDMHRAGLRVVLDVVYNHTWPPEGEGSAFWQTVPYWWFRTDDRGQVLNESGVGNATADERPMVRKFIRDSLLYWVREYRVDGFRFDLLGMHHPESVRDWAAAVRAERPDAILYGEPWTGGGPTHFPTGAQRGTGFAVFNDRFRGVFRGELDGATPGFVMGGGADPERLRKSVLGWIDSAQGVGDGTMDSPAETINYISAHDNLTLWDRVARSLPANEAHQESAVRLAGAAVLLSQGVPFLEGGAQIGRTKGGNPNSYNAGDLVNGYDWERAERFDALNAWYQGLIRLRLAHPVFRMDDAAQVRAASEFLPGPTPNTLVWTLREGPRRYLVVLHGGLGPVTLELPSGKWGVLADGRQADATPLRTVETSARVQPLSAMVFMQ